jgi:hypothetical protein
MMAAIALFIRSWDWRRFDDAWRRAVPALLVALVLLDPFPFLRLLRFDLQEPNLRVGHLAREAASHLTVDEKLVLVVPGDTGSVAPALETLLRDAPPRRPALDLAIASDLSTAFAMTGFDHALLSCLPRAKGGATHGSAALLKRGASGWEVEASWPYDPVPRRARWSQVLAPAALCLGG